MGTMVSISIGNFDFLSLKNSLGDLVMCFSNDELHIEQSFNDDDESYIKRYYLSTVGKIKMRLDVLGITLNAAKDVFEKQKEEHLEFLYSYCEDNKEIELYENEFSFESWSVAAKKYATLLADETYDYYKNLKKEIPHSTSEKLVLESLLDPLSETFFGIEEESYSPEWEVFRVLLEAFDEDCAVCLDYTELFESGWCDPVPETEIATFSKTIILTEGKYDTYVISEAMDLLYPGMQKFYSFMDFSSVNVQGSTNFLTHYLKAFIGAKIQNRIIALYDNDSAGICEIANLKSIVIPSNIKVMHLPDLEFCKCYPTIGPSHNEPTNINGRACSIELFLGKDVLQENNDFIPVRWTGYNDKMKQYQGEILHKSFIQKNFEDKLKKAKENGISDKNNWSELNLLLNEIFNAFI